MPVSFVRVVGGSKHLSCTRLGCRCQLCIVSSENIYPDIVRKPRASKRKYLLDQPLAVLTLHELVNESRVLLLHLVVLLGEAGQVGDQVFEILNSLLQSDTLQQQAKEN